MESATPTRVVPGSTLLARLRSARRPPEWAAVALAAMCVLALVGYLAFPTYPTYDSFYALLWGRDVLHLHLPDFRVYRGPTEHPLAIAFGIVCSLFGQGGARLMVLGSIASFVAVVAGMYRLWRACFGPGGGVVAGVVVLGRFFLPEPAAPGVQGLSGVLGSVWTFAVRIDKLPVLIGALAGIGLSIWLTPARTRVPLAALLLLVGVFVAEGVLGASVIDRYLLGAAAVALLFCAL